MMDGQPDFSLRIEHATKVTPRNSKVWLRLDGLQIACLEPPRETQISNTITVRSDALSDRLASSASMQEALAAVAQDPLAQVLVPVCR
jgi:hypothetical protein